MQTIFSNIIKKTGCTSRARIQGRDDKERYTGIALLGNCRYPNAHLVRRLPRNLSQSAVRCVVFLTPPRTHEHRVADCVP